jgi:hypothetical protein
VSAYAIAGGPRPDAWRFTVEGADGRDVVVRREEDLDGDGRVDTWEWVAPDGTPVRRALDLDGDGRPDVVLTLEQGRVVRREVVTSTGVAPATVSTVDGGRLQRKEWREGRDGRGQLVEDWRAGTLVRVREDFATLEPPPAPPPEHGGAASRAGPAGAAPGPAGRDQK